MRLEVCWEGGLTGAVRPAGIVGEGALGRRGGKARIVHDGKGIASLVQLERQQPGLTQELLVQLGKRTALGAQQAALVPRVDARGEAADESTAQQARWYAHADMSAEIKRAHHDNALGCKQRT